jgi:hypothetical protein
MKFAALNVSLGVLRTYSKALRPGPRWSRLSWWYSLQSCKAQGNTLEAGNSFYGPETMDLICFQVLVFKKFDELREAFFLPPQRMNDLTCFRRFMPECDGTSARTRSNATWAKMIVYKEERDS